MKNVIKNVTTYGGGNIPAEPAGFFLFLASILLCMDMLYIYYNP